MKYYTDINLKDFNNSHTIAYYYVESIAQGRKLEILEVGCSAGYFGSLLCKSGHIVWGVEPDKESSSEAEKSLNYVFNGSLDDFFSSYPDKKFDVIIFGDVIEHLSNPEAVLISLQQNLTTDGCIVASIPNVAHLSVRAMLFEGRWDYNELGIMDNTHLHFYTRNTIIDLFENAGFNVNDIQHTKLSLSDIEIATNSHCNHKIARLIQDAYSNDESLNIFQYVLLANIGKVLPSNNPAVEKSSIPQSDGYIKLNRYLSEHNKDLQVQLSKQLNYSTELQNTNKLLSEKTKDLQVQLSKQLNYSTELQNTNKLLSEKTIKLQNSITEIKQSTSWRVTKIIRQLGRLLKK